MGQVKGASIIEGLKGMLMPFFYEFINEDVDEDYDNLSMGH
jgi:hypothetical protein